MNYVYCEIKMSLHYTPAGAETYYENPLQLYVKYGSNPKEQTIFGKKFKQWHLKDRTVTLTGTSNKGGPIFADHADIIVPINSAEFIHQVGVSKALANPIHGSFRKEAFNSRNIECIIDSGGFQMLKGITDFVHPDSVIKEYNKCANIGMLLDLPMRSAYEKYYFEAVSQLIKTNDKYIIERLDKGIDLALISHGSSLELRKKRLDILDRDAAVVAVAGLNVNPKVEIDKIYNIIENLMYVLHRYRKTARHFHVLGVTSKLWMFIYALIDACSFVKSIGADSVSHRLSAITGNYMLTDFTNVPLPRKLSYKKPLLCSCPVCYSVGDTRLLNSYQLLEAHNLWSVVKQAEVLSSVAKSYIKGGISLNEISSMLGLGSKTNVNKLQRLVNYILEINASNVFKPIKKDRLKGSLFVAERETSLKDNAEDHYGKILKNYGKFYKKKFI